MTSTEPIASAPRAETGPRLRAAVIGAGWYAAQSHIPNLAARPEIALDGVCRLGPAQLARARGHFGFAYGSERFEEVLARAPDIVVVSSPHHLHYRHALAALEGGAHVLCEKPMTLDPAEAWSLVRVARERGRHLLVANGYHYLPGVDALRRRVAEGAIGAIEHAAVSFVSATRDVFLGERGLDAWETTFFRPDRRTWQEPAQGGGFAYGQMSHSLALLYFLTGLEPRSVSALSVSPGRVDLADAGALLLSNGAVASLSGAAAMPQGNRALMRVVLAGSEGVLTADLDRDHAEIRAASGVETVPVAPGAWVYDCKGPVDALVDLALGAADEAANLSPGRIGAAATATIAAMLASSRSGGQPQPVATEAA